MLKVGKVPVMNMQRFLRSQINIMKALLEEKYESQSSCNDIRKLLMTTEDINFK